MRVTTGMRLKEIPGDRMREVRGLSVGAPGATLSLRGASGLRTGAGSSRTTGSTMGDFDARRLPGSPWRFFTFTLGFDFLE